jgi:hypothetical protein
MEPEPGFFVPALGNKYTAGNAAQKRAVLMSCKNRETILTF